ncbi:MAG: hypothetical protein DWI21_12445 [Planctomycetota bacterium]|nr:MAG: hypothetical protein DWI21_12445 [Planctomycetota bacterium]
MPQSTVAVFRVGTWSVTGIRLGGRGWKDRAANPQLTRFSEVTILPHANSAGGQGELTQFAEAA